jgi:hypothetical protein
VDASETLAKEYLSSLQPGNIVYEPEGYKKPPDFAINERIAVEVRRLNQNFVSESGTRGLEEFRIPLMEHMPELLESLGPPTAGQSWMVDYRFSRPLLLSMCQLFQAIRKKLEDFRSGREEGTEFVITKGFHLRLTPLGNAHSYCFVAGPCVDRDANGFVIPKLAENLQICIQEKSRKVAGVRKKYPEWWLVLIDHINDGQMESLNVQHDWDKVILVNPRNPKQAFEI